MKAKIFIITGVISLAGLGWLVGNSNSNHAPKSTEKAEVQAPKARTGAESVGEVQQKAADILADYRSRHPDDLQKGSEITAIETDVAPALKEYESVSSKIKAESLVLGQMKDQLDQAILNKAAQSEIEELNRRFEEKAVAMQELQKELHNVYLQAMASYDKAIETHVQ